MEMCREVVLSAYQSKQVANLASHISDQSTAATKPLSSVTEIVDEDVRSEPSPSLQIQKKDFAHDYSAKAVEILSG